MNAGAFANLQCIVSSGDTPITISWSFPGHQHESYGISTVKVAERVSLLTINEVRAEHAGNYTCIAKNQAGSVSRTAELLINSLF